jgi:hypothetical protein
MSAKLFVPEGAPAHASGGAVPTPSQVKRDGIAAPSVNAVDVNVNPAV